MRNAPNMPINKQAKSKKRILVVENDPELRYILSLIFDDENYEYQMFSETFDIIELAKQYQPSLVLLDFRLPLVNGGELCLQLKREQMTCKIPVIIYSAAPNVFHSVKDYRQDMFLAKPFDLDELLNKINQLTFRVPIH
jgi:DNA-binding response OmpR family regulator